MTNIYTEDGAELTAGDRAYNYYDRKAGTVGTIERDGWFDFTHDDGGSAFLNGERVCSLDYARRRGWVA
jgi:hypothetical protein